MTKKSKKLEKWDNGRLKKKASELKVLYSFYDDKYLAKVFGCAIKDIQEFANEFKLNKNVRKRKRAIVSSPWRNFSVDEVKFLKSIYGSTDDSELAKVMDTDSRTISEFAKAFSLEKSRKYLREVRNREKKTDAMSPKKINSRMRILYPYYDDKYLAKLFKCDIREIREFARVNKLKKHVPKEGDN